MVNEIDAILDDLICRWHRWSASQGLEGDYPTINPTCRMYRRPYHTITDRRDLDDDIEAIIMGGVDQCVHRLVDPWRSAVHVNARNLACGVSVWNSPRLPACREERAVVVMEARVKLLRELQSAGLV